MGIHIELQNLMRDFLLLALTGISWVYTSKKIRDENQFTWFPIQEVAKLFAGIFTTIIPAIAILKAGNDGDMKSIIGAVSTSSGDSKLGIGSPVPVCLTSLAGLLSVDVLGVSLESVGDLRLDLGEPLSFGVDGEEAG